jgi:phenylacetate-CoA ligase
MERGELYGALYRRVLYPTWEAGVRRRPTLARLAYLAQTQWRSRDELDALQMGELRRLVRHAALNVPMYHGLVAEELRTIDDLRKLPILSREQLIAAGDERRSRVPPLPTIMKSTSGSSGTPLKFAYEPDSDYWRQAVKLRGYGWAGYRAGDPTLFYWGAPPLPAPAKTRAKVALDRASRRELYVDCTPRGDDDFAAVVDTIRKMKPHAIVAYTQGAAELSRWILERGARTWNPIPVLCARRAPVRE